jgi:hypothetical protein
MAVPSSKWGIKRLGEFKAAGEEVALVLADLVINGRTRKVIMQAPKNGFFYVLDRATGELLAADWSSLSATLAALALGDALRLNREHHFALISELDRVR